MAMAVMVVIILLNILLLLVVMRVGTREDFHDEMDAEQSVAVATWRSRRAAEAAETPPSESDGSA